MTEEAAKKTKPELTREIIKAVMAQHQIITAEDMQSFERNAAQWREKPTDFEDWSLGRSYIYMQILDKLATNPPPGRSAGMLIITAIKDVRDQVFTLVELLEETRTGKKRKT